MSPTQVTALTWLGEVVPEASAPESMVLPKGLRDLGRLGVGGMGEVRLAHEAAFERAVAVKVMSPGAARSPELVARFRSEAQFMASLDHPSIVPVYARGLLEDGRPWYTMRRVRGKELHEALAAGELSLFEGVDRVRRVAQALAYAHEQGLLHRDVTPRNILLGPFGEVLLLDWGLAVPEGHRVGRVMGTPGFAAPEQTVEGEPQTRAVDVFALGQVLARVLRSTPPAPDELLEWVDVATEPEPGRRPTARAVAEALQDWLLGAHARERARAIWQRHRPLALSAASLRAEATGLRHDAEVALDRLGPTAPVAAKAPHWATLERAEASELEAEDLEARWVGGLHAAQRVAPDLPEVRVDLAAHHHRAAVEAQARGDRQQVAHHRRRLATYDDGRFASFLAGRRRLHLVVEPPDARAVVRAFVEVHRRRQPGPVLHDGPLPAGGLEVPALALGVELSAPGRDPILVPIDARREPRPPPPGRSACIRLPVAGSVRSDEVWVQGGWFRSGGDPEAQDGLPARTLWVDTFVMKRAPVRFDAYLAYLQDLAQRGRLEEALGRITPGFEGRRPDHRIIGFEGGRFVPSSDQSDAVVPDLAGPVTELCLPDAEAYARWLGEREGLSWRLPHEFEVEKAARGVDGRAFPWGDAFEPSWCSNAISTRPPQVRPIGRHPEDLSVYGVRDLAGGARTWCGHPYRVSAPADGSVVEPGDRTGDPAVGVARGGSFASAGPACRAAARFPWPSLGASQGIGLHLVRTPSDDVFLRG